MACQNSCNDYVRKATEIIVATVIDYANRGYGRSTAIEQAALALEMSPRKTFSVFYERPFAIGRDEYHRLHRRYAAHLEAKADELAQRSREARERARVLRQQQELGVG